MSEYKIGKIYKIMYIGNENIHITYIGSTFNTLRDRFYNHKAKKNCAIYSYFEEYGIENFKIFLIKEYEVCDLKHLQLYEQLWMNKLKNININKAFQIDKLYNKQYSKLNKIKNNIRSKKWNEQNKEITNIRSKKWNEQNKEIIKIYNKERYIKNKESILCECGSNVTKYNLNNHIKTKKHINFINKNT
jgi:hypothetical protein